MKGIVVKERIKRNISLLMCTILIGMTAIGCGEKTEQKESNKNTLTINNGKGYIADEFFDNLKKKYNDIINKFRKIYLLIFHPKSFIFSL